MSNKGNVGFEMNVYPKLAQTIMDAPGAASTD